MRQVILDKFAVSYWNDVIDAWTVEMGVYRVEISQRGSTEMAHTRKNGGCQMEGWNLEAEPAD